MKTRRKETTRKIWEYMGGNIKMDIKETGWEDVDWIHLAQDRDLWWALVNTVINLRGT
jgi:hypothetical protein